MFRTKCALSVVTLPGWKQLLESKDSSLVFTLASSKLLFMTQMDGSLLICYNTSNESKPFCVLVTDEVPVKPCLTLKIHTAIICWQFLASQGTSGWGFTNITFQVLFRILIFANTWCYLDELNHCCVSWKFERWINSTVLQTKLSVLNIVFILNKSNLL